LKIDALQFYVPVFYMAG